MKKMLLFVLMLIPLTSVGQGWYRNYEKYWWYRYRLVNDFMKVGPNYGESIPAYTRERGEVDDNGKRGRGYIHWGDGTQALGHYLAMTALEYRILHANSWSTSRTSYENDNAQTAFQRLDRDAESYCKDIHNTYPNKPNFSQSNGFFIRDDVSRLFCDTNIKFFNRPGIVNLNPVGDPHKYHIGNPAYAWPYRDAFQYSVGLSDYMIRSEISDVDWQYDYNYHWFKYWLTNFSSPPSPNVTGYPPQYPTEENQDQLSEMFVGLGLSQKYMGSFNGINLSNKAADNILRTEAYAGSSPTPWVIKNPLTTHCVYGIETDQYFWANGCLVSGAVMLQAAPAAAKATRLLCGTNATTLSLEASALNNWPVFQFTQFISGQNAIYQDNYVAFSRNWYSIYLIYFPVPINNSWNRLLAHSQNNNYQTPHLPFIYKLNYPNTTSNALECPSCHEKRLDVSAPCGNFSYNHTGVWPDIGSDEWSGQDRLSAASKRKSKDYDADFNNVDYMEYFNLYAILKKDYLQWIFNPYYEERYDINYPDINGRGSNVRYLTLHYLEYLGLVDKIRADGHITFRGAKVVDILPGFNTDRGAFFEAYVKDYECGRETECGSDGTYHYAIETIPVRNGEAFDCGPIDYNPRNTKYIPEEGGGDGSSHPTRGALEEPADSLDDSMPLAENDAVLRDSARQFISRIADKDERNYFLQYFGLNDTVASRHAPLKIVNSDNTIQIFPNPNHGTFTIKFAKAGDYVLEVKDVLGKTICTKSGIHGPSQEITLPQVSPGNYTIYIRGSDTWFVDKLTIN